MSNKLKDPKELLIESGFEMDDFGCGRIKGRNFRFFEHTGILEIGESDKTFDRWANSCELEFALWQKKGQREFLRWFNNFGGE